MAVEVWKCQGGGGKVRGAFIYPSLTADSCAQYGHGQLTKTKAKLANSLCGCLYSPTMHAQNIYIYIYLAIAISSLPLSAPPCLPSLSMTSYKSINQFQCWHESTTFIQSTPCLSYLLKYFYLNWPSNQSFFFTSFCNASGVCNNTGSFRKKETARGTSGVSQFNPRQLSPELLVFENLDCWQALRKIKQLFHPYPRAFLCV